MSVMKPEDVSEAFAEALRNDDLDSLLELYEPDAMYVARSGAIAVGIDEIREALRRLLSVQKKQYQVKNRYCIVNGDIALIRARWHMNGIPSDGTTAEWHGESSEVIHRQPDGTWRYAIDAPFGAS